MRLSLDADSTNTQYQSLHHRSTRNGEGGQPLWRCSLLLVMLSLLLSLLLPPPPLLELLLLLLLELLLLDGPACATAKCVLQSCVVSLFSLATVTVDGD